MPTSVDPVRKSGESPSTHTPDWISLSGIDPGARELYRLIKMHVTSSYGDGLLLGDLAALMGYSRGDKISRFVLKLQEIGALSIELAGMPARYDFILYEEPPDEYTGPRTLADWYQMNPVTKEDVPVPIVRRSRRPYSEIAEGLAVAKGSVVYYLRHPEKRIKIGFSKRLGARIENLEERFGPLELLGTEPGGRATERRRHLQFAAQQITDLPKWHGSEWFRPDRRLYAHIESLAGGAQ